MKEWTRDIPGRDGPFIPDESLPEIVRKYLVRTGVVTLTHEQYGQLWDAAYARNEEGCPYPLHRDFLTGRHNHHRRYVGTICDKEDDLMGGLVVVQCEACGNVTFQTPVAIG